MNKILRNPNILEINRAIEDNLYNFWRTCSKIDNKNVKFTENENFYRFSAGIPIFLVNGVLDTKIPSEIAEETISGIFQSFKHDMLPFNWVVGPSSKPSNLRELLLLKNPSFKVDLPGLALNLNGLSNEIKDLPNITTVKVQDIETFKQWTEVILNAFEIPMDLLYDFYVNSFSSVFLNGTSTINAYLSYFNEKPAACSIGFYGSGVIGLYGIATLKEARQNGLGSAVTLAPLYEAKILGYEIGILHSTEMGLKLYKKLGFKEYIQIERFVWNLS